MLMTAAKHDWTTTEGIVVGLQELDLEGYGTAFQVYRDSMPIDGKAARQVIIKAITVPAVMERYQNVLRRMIADEDSPDYYAAAVQVGPEGLLAFEHGDFKTTIDLADSGLQVAMPKQRKTRRRQQVEERAEALDRKREKIKETGEEDYMLHANQVGYLLRNVRLNFLHSKNMYTSSVKMRINNLTLDQLQSFIDATGSQTLAALSTHEGTRPVSADGETGIYSGWAGFAREVIDFLNLELVVDVDGIAAQYRTIIADTGFETLDRWDADTETVLGQLIDRRSDLDAETIREWFTEGYGGTIMVD